MPIELTNEYVKTAITYYDTIMYYLLINRVAIQRVSMIDNKESCFIID